MGTNPSNTAQKAKYIRNILKLRYFDPEFSTQAVRARDPYVQLSWSPLPPYVQEYRQIRRLQKDLQQEVINQHVTRPLIDAAGRALGIMDDSGHLYLECPDDANIVMDFIIYETWDNASNAVQLYFNSHSNLSGAEREIMDGMLHARTSLYEIQYIDGIFLTLRDLLAEESSVARGDCPLADIGLSQSARPGTLLFIRVIPLGKVQITSGIIFPFAGSYKLELLAAFDVQFQANASGAVDPIEKYAFFFKQHRKRGIPISYLDV